MRISSRKRNTQGILSYAQVHVQQESEQPLFVDADIDLIAVFPCISTVNVLAKCVSDHYADVYIPDLFDISWRSVSPKP